MIRHAAGALLALTVLAAPAAEASVVVSSGTRGATIFATGPVGQSFIADGVQLTSFGFQFAVANAATAATPITLQLLNEAGLSGSVIATRSATLSIPTGRTPTWFDFDLTGTSLTQGQSYTALLSTAGNRLAVYFGPTLSTSGVPATGDAYTGGQLVSTSPVDASGSSGYCATSGACDTNFRFTTLSAASAVPEPSTWLTMVSGFAMAGGAIRRRRRYSSPKAAGQRPRMFELAKRPRRALSGHFLP